MKTLRRIALLMIVAAFSLGTMGCHSSSRCKNCADHPQGDHPKGEHPKGDHPRH